MRRTVLKNFALFRGKHLCWQGRAKQGSAGGVTLPPTFFKFVGILTKYVGKIS